MTRPIVIGPQWAAKRQEIYEAILHDGWRMVDVAEFYGISHEYARQIVRQLDIPYSAAQNGVQLWCPWPAMRASKSRPRIRWSVKWERCIDCGTTERRHTRHGRCTTCESRWRYAQPEEWQHQQAAIARWQKRHPEATRRTMYAAQKRLRERRKAGGVCLTCPQAATVGPRGGTNYCDDCQAARNAYHAAWYAKRKAPEKPQGPDLHESRP